MPKSSKLLALLSAYCLIGSPLSAMDEDDDWEGPSARFQWDKCIQQPLDKTQRKAIFDDIDHVKAFRPNGFEGTLYVVNLRQPDYGTITIEHRGNRWLVSGIGRNYWVDRADYDAESRTIKMTISWRVEGPLPDENSYWRAGGIGHCIDQNVPDAGVVFNKSAGEFTPDPRSDQFFKWITRP